MFMPVIYFDVLQHICPPAKCFCWDNKQKVWTYHISTLINESDPNGGQIGSRFFAVSATVLEFPHLMPGAVEELIGLGSSFDGTRLAPAGTVWHLILINGSTIIWPDHKGKTADLR